MAYTLRFVADELRRLRSLDVQDRGALRRWYEEARSLQEALGAEGSEIPHFHFIMHYLIDADIRLKDPAYRVSQESRLEEVINELLAIPT